MLEVSIDPRQGAESYSHVISSPEGYKEPVLPSEELFDATFRLGELFARHGRRWRRALYRVDREASDNWRYVVDFEYPEV